MFKILYETKYDQQIIAGDPVLHPAVAVEELGGGQGVRPPHGPQPRHHLRRREKVEEEAADRLPVLQPQASQLLGLQILLL